MPNPQAPPAKPSNRLLARLPPSVYARLLASLQGVPLPFKQVLYQAYAAIDYVYFPIRGVISAMTIMEDGKAIEVATIGSEGMVGLTAFVGGETSPNEVMVQVEGEALRMPAEVFKKAASRDGPLRQLLVLYHTAYQTQVSYAVACNGLHTIEKRCCRWLLMAQDRVRTEVVPLTHEFLSTMLGVQRSSLTEVLQPLQERGLIQNHGRGKITILDRKGLEATACECYRRVEEEYARLLG
jgi:CRP-like cAMP-binding protein